MLEEVWRWVRSFSLPCSPVFPLARSSVPFSNRKERKTSKRPHFAGDIWAFFCLCLLYIPVTLGTAVRPPFPRRCSTLPPNLTPLSVKHGGAAHTTSCVDRHNTARGNESTTKPRDDESVPAQDYSGSFLSSEGSFDFDISRSAVLRQSHRERLRPCVLELCSLADIISGTHTHLQAGSQHASNM